MQGKIHSFDTFSTLDGPGIRYVVFLQGCKMRCKYCHNPDTWSLDNGLRYEVKEVMELILKNKDVYIRSGGGITVTGGEPLLQIDFLIELFKLAKNEGLSTIVDTSAYYNLHNDEKEKLDELLNYTDCFIISIKQMNSKKHRNLTGIDNIRILENIKYIDKTGKIKIHIRYLVVPTITDEIDDILKVKEFIHSLNNVEKVEILPYHKMAIHKWAELGLKYELDNINEPDGKFIEHLQEIIDI